MNEQDRDLSGRAAHPSTSTRESMEHINATKFIAESMDFEEMETVMWRKVVLLQYEIFNHRFLISLSL